MMEVRNNLNPNLCDDVSINFVTLHFCKYNNFLSLALFDHLKEVDYLL